MPEWKPKVRERLAALQLQPEREAEVVEEIAHHLEDRYAELRGGGATEEEAHCGALEELSDTDLLALELRKIERGESRDPVQAGAMKTGHMIADLWRDLRYGARMLRQNPGFTAVVVLTLALGIGANTTVFTLINTIFLNPLPVHRASELVAVYTLDTKNTAPSGNMLPMSYLNLKDFLEKNEVFSSLAGYSAPLPLTSLNGTEPERIFTELVTANYFETLGLRPVMGRFFSPEEDRTPGTHPVVVIGYAPWQRRFGGAPDIVGRTIKLNNLVFTIIGVAPEGFKGVNAVFGPDIWIPSMMAEQVLPTQLRDWLRERGALAFRGAGRLKPGVNVAQAEANLKTVAAALEREYPQSNTGRSVALRPLAEATLFGDMRQPLLFGSSVLMAIVGLVLLIACSNVANLLLARATARRQEIAVRLALGAGRPRLVRQFLTESVLLGLASGMLGLGFAYAGCQFLWSFRPAEVAQNFVEPKLDTNVFVFALLVSVLTGLIFGLVPALESSRSDIVGALKEAMRTAGRSRRRISFANALLVGQVALSLVSLITAGLFLRSIRRAYTIDPGFETKRLAVLLISPGQAGYDQARSEQFYREARARASTVPGVMSVSWAANLPLWARLSRAIFIEGQEQRERSNPTMTLVNTVDLDYFATVGIALTRGRDFTAADRDGAVPVAIINQTMASKYWPNQEPLGKRFKFSGDKFFRQIVGIVKTARYQTLGEDPQPCAYLPLRQNFSDAMVLYVRTEGDPAAVLSAVQREVRSIDTHIELGDVRTVGKVIDQALWSAKMGVGLLGVFGLLALGLASVGLYGVMAYTVNLRRREIGVRMALGAGQASVLRLVLRQGMTLVAAGIIVGLGASFLVGHALSALLYGVSPADPISLTVASLTLGIVATLACYLPARRASQVDPLAALHEA